MSDSVLSQTAAAVPLSPEELPRLSAGAAGSSAAEAAVVSSAQLLQGRKAVQIEHNGALYLLRTTKLGKLILTK